MSDNLNSPPEDESVDEFADEFQEGDETVHGFGKTGFKNARKNLALCHHFFVVGGFDHDPTPAQ